MQLACYFLTCCQAFRLLGFPTILNFQNQEEICLGRYIKREQIDIARAPKPTYHIRDYYCLGISVAKCEYCGAEIELPFKCNYCGKYFCEAHRLLENHNCSNAPARTPLGSFQTKQLISDIAKKKKIETMPSCTVLEGETKTYDNIHGHHFNVPIKVYSDEKYRDKLNKARTLSEVEHILRDYRRHEQ